VSALRCIVFLLSFLLAAAACPVEAAQSGLGREQALRQLARPSVEQRRLAAERLGEVGTSADVRVMLRTLRDVDGEVRAAAEAAIWQVWSRSGDEEADGLLAAGTVQMNSGALTEAIATFTAVVRRKPGFAEGWNKRATAHFLAGDLDRSASDCEQVLRLNPQHFGALAGYGQISARRDRPELALQYFERALALNPNMHGVAANVHALRSLLKERRGRMI